MKTLLNPSHVSRCHQLYEDAAAQNGINCFDQMIRLQQVRLDFVSIFTNEGFIIRLIGVLMLSDGRAAQRARNIPGNRRPVERRSGGQPPCYRYATGRLFPMNRVRQLHYGVRY